MKKEQIDNIANEIINLYEGYSPDQYNERMSYQQHLMQCVQLAIQEGYDNEVILASFLHNIGHHGMNAGMSLDIDGFEISDPGEFGVQYLTLKEFSGKIIYFVKSYVTAKRYLSWESAEYYNKLSMEAKRNLIYQGGKMTNKEALHFEQHPLFDLIIKLSYLKEEAGLKKMQTPGISFIKELIKDHLNGQGLSFQNFPPRVARHSTLRKSYNDNQLKTFPFSVFNSTPACRQAGSK